MPLLPTPGGSRQQLLTILEAANSDEGQALEKLLSTTPDAHAALLRVLTQLDYKESDARVHWEALQKHRDELTQTLRASPLGGALCFRAFGWLSGRETRPAGDVINSGAQPGLVLHFRAHSRPVRGTYSVCVHRRPRCL